MRLQIENRHYGQDDPHKATVVIFDNVKSFEIDDGIRSRNDVKFFTRLFIHFEFDEDFEIKESAKLQTVSLPYYEVIEEKYIALDERRYNEYVYEMITIQPPKIYVREMEKGIDTIVKATGEGRKDLDENTLVMCKAQESGNEGWVLQLYVEGGITKPDILSKERCNNWLYIVPLKKFLPHRVGWRPNICFNWANFGKEPETEKQ